MTDLGRRDILRLFAAQALFGLAPIAVSSSAEPDNSSDPGDPPSSAAGAAGGTSGSGETAGSGEATVGPAQAAPGTFAGAEALTAALGAVPRDPKVVFGIGVVDGRTGRRFVHDPNGPHEMASTVKVDLLTGVVLRAQRAGRALTSGERARATSMIQASDNAAADALWAANGGAGGMGGIWNALGLTSMHPGPRGRWGLSSTSVEDRMRLLDLLVGGCAEIPAERTTYVLGLMSQVTPSQRWGVGGVARPGEAVAVKNGWLPRNTEGGRWIVSTTGRLTGPETDLRLAGLSHGHRTQRDGITFLEAALAAARQHLGV